MIIIHWYNLQNGVYRILELPSVILNPVRMSGLEDSPYELSNELRGPWGGVRDRKLISRMQLLPLSDSLCTLDFSFSVDISVDLMLKK